MRRVLLSLAFLFSFAATAFTAPNPPPVKKSTSSTWVGFGLVVGLNGTGSNTAFTQQLVVDLLQRMPKGQAPDGLEAGSVAAVIVQAEFPIGSAPGEAFPVTVSILDDATSLRGGRLLATPLKDASGKQRAIAQGDLRRPSANNPIAGTRAPFVCDGFVCDTVVRDVLSAPVPSAPVAREIVGPEFPHRARSRWLRSTGNPLDLAIEGDGFFRLDHPDGGVLYARSGAFALNADGEIVLASRAIAGLRLSPRITVPTDCVSIVFGTDGTAQALRAGDTTVTNIGRLEITRFANPAGLKRVSRGLYEAAAAAGTPTLVMPGLAGAGMIRSGFLEAGRRGEAHGR